METFAVVFEQPEVLSMKRLALVDAGPTDVVIDVDFTGISTGTERLLYTGTMPPFPGLGYPLVPGYETVGTIVKAGPDSGHVVGETVYVTGARCYADARGLFGGAAERLVVPGAKAWKVPADLGEQGALFALAATAYHAVVAGDIAGRHPDLIIGHGALGRLVARVVQTLNPGSQPTVWETNPIRRAGTHAYPVIDPSEDTRKDYRCICDVSGAHIFDQLIARLAPKGELVLAGFYHEPVAFQFPMAFMKEVRIRVAAEWSDADLAATIAHVRDGSLSLDGLVTHRALATDAASAYATAFGDPSCVKMVLDWRTCE